jgi:hypothetical protein
MNLLRDRELVNIGANRYAVRSMRVGAIVYNGSLVHVVAAGSSLQRVQPAGASGDLAEMVRVAAGLSTTYYHDYALGGAAIQYYYDVHPFVWQVALATTNGYTSPAGAIIIADWGCAANEPGDQPTYDTYAIRKARAGVIYETAIRDCLASGYRVLMMDFTECFTDNGDGHTYGYWLRAAQDTFYANLGGLITRFATRDVMGAHWDDPTYYDDGIHFGKKATDLIVPALASALTAMRATPP